MLQRVQNIDTYQPHLHAGSEAWEFSAPVIGWHWAAAAPERGHVLFLHGWGEHCGVYNTEPADVIGKLCAAGYSVYAYDQRGHGHSAGPRGILTAEQMLEDLAAARDFLHEKNSSSPLFLVGTSMGGLLSLISAAEDSRNLAGVVAAAPSLAVGAEEPAMLRSLAPLAVWLWPSAKLTSSRSSFMLRKSPSRSKDPLLQHGIRAKTALALMQLGENAWEKYPRLAVPVLTLQGSDDLLSPPLHAHRLKELLGDRMTLHEFTGFRHRLLNHKTEHAAVFGEVLDFLNRQTV